VARQVAWQVAQGGAWVGGGGAEPGGARQAAVRSGQVIRPGSSTGAGRRDLAGGGACVQSLIWEEHEEHVAGREHRSG
jgi:hypothetical protein